MYKKAKNPKVEELTKSVKDRSYHLGSLQVIKPGSLNTKGKPSRFCCWCTEGELFYGNQKYCSNDCSESAEAWAYPQKELGLKLLLIKQEWKCGHCQYDYRPFIDAIIEKDRSRYGAAYEIDKIPFHYLKRLKYQVPKDKKPEVDHIIPISKGGESLGFFNHQAICYTCHKIKSKQDNSGPRKKS